MNNKNLDLLKTIFYNRKIGDLPNDFVEFLKDEERINNHHVNQSEDYFAHFENDDISLYLKTYEEDFMELLMGNFYDMFEWKNKRGER